MPLSIRVLLVASTPITQTAVRAILATVDDLTVIDDDLDPTRPRGQDALYDVMLIEAMDHRVWIIIRDLQQVFPALRFILLVEEQSEVINHRLLEARVAACVLKSQISKSLIHVIRAVAEGEHLFGHAVVEKLIEQAQKPALLDKSSDLTEREWQVLELLAQGYNDGEIATALNLTPQTIRNKLTKIYEKLGVHTRAKAIIWFHHYGSDWNRG